jgi:GNAT superfamily N-acetyltransferase
MIALPTGYELREGADPVAAHAFLTESYWAEGIALDTVERAFAASMPVSVWFDQAQVALARVISDFATFAYLQDVYVLDGHRGIGLSKALIRYLLDHPKLQNIGRWALYTKDAQELYEQFGWRQYPWPERMMIIDHKVFPK